MLPVRHPDLSPKSKAKTGQFSAAGHQPPFENLRMTARLATSTQPHPPTARRVGMRAYPLLLSVWISACGGGGGGDSGSGGGSPTPMPLVLSGVVTVGAAVGAASVSLLDASGQTLGTATAHPVDGSYRITLSTSSPPLPLFLQAQGTDAGGRPVLLHSLVPSLSSTGATAHITPLTQAVAALALGADPQAAFAKPADAALPSTTALLTPAADFLKTLLKSPLADVKISDATKLDLLSDSGFATPKSAADLLLESTRVQVEPQSGRLQLGSKFLANPAPEVEVNLAGARAELLKGSTGTPTAAITTSAQITSAAATVLGVAGSLDGIASTLNPLLAQTSTDAATYKASAALSGYTQFNGRSADELAASLVAWSAAGLQLAPLQVLGCEDEVLKKGDCLKVRVAAPLVDRSGKTQDRLVDIASYSSTAKRWALVGNGKALVFAVRAASWLRLDGAGAAETGSNPSSGVELLLQGKNSALTADLITAGTVQTPLGFALPLAACQRLNLCIAQPGDTSVVPTAGLGDQLLAPGSVGWLGNGDGLRGALYKASYSLSGTAENRVAYLNAGILISPTAARHPTLDGVSSSAALTPASMRAGLKLNWSTWAKANPDLRVVQVLAVVRYSDRVSLRDLDPKGATQLDVAATGAIPGFTATGHDVWLMASDGLGRKLATRYALGL